MHIKEQLNSRLHCSTMCSSFLIKEFSRKFFSVLHGEIFDLRCKGARLESLCTSWESKSMIFSLVKEHAAQVKKSQKSDFFIILHLLSIIQSLRSFLTVFRCFDESTVFSTFVFYFSHLLSKRDTPDEHTMKCLASGSNAKRRYDFK